MYLSESLPPIPVFQSSTGGTDAIGLGACTDGSCANNVNAQVDEDGDGTANVDDTDADGNGVADSSDPCNTSGCGNPLQRDGNNDGIPDLYQSSYAALTDADNDDIPDIFDDDIDGDGSKNEVDTDDDGDGIPDATDTDADGDGVPDQVATDTDHDGVPNYCDSDIDGDGIANTADTDTDGDGTLDTNDTDKNGDGVADTSETTDTDGDGIPNTFDTSSDTCTGSVSCSSNFECQLFADLDSSDAFETDNSACVSGCCAVVQNAEICDDNIDNDNDGFTDCLDSDCATGAACE